ERQNCKDYRAHRSLLERGSVKNLISASFARAPPEDNRGTPGIVMRFSKGSSQTKSPALLPGFRVFCF
ncbi:hypothetical protein, partial [Roseibium sp.]|uniref:hypothetical protein n=1 Tax=Roseibium sp. TaxID=1936156 RepID=UPI003D0DD794